MVIKNATGLQNIHFGIAWYHAYVTHMFMWPFWACLNLSMLSPKTHLRWFILALNELWIRYHRINGRKWISAYLSLCSLTNKRQNDCHTHVTLVAFRLADTCCAHLIGVTFICCFSCFKHALCDAVTHIQVIFSYM